MSVKSGTSLYWETENWHFLLKSQVIEEEVAEDGIKEEDHQDQQWLMTRPHSLCSEHPGYLGEEEDHQPLDHQGVRVVDQRRVGEDTYQGPSSEKTS